MSKNSSGRRVAIGCLSIFGYPVTLFGLYYWFGKPWCFDNACTDTATTGPMITAIGLIPTALALLITFVNRKK